MTFIKGSHFSLQHKCCKHFSTFFRLNLLSFHVPKCSFWLKIFFHQSNFQTKSEIWSNKKYQKSKSRKIYLHSLKIRLSFHKIFHLLFRFKSSSFEIWSTFLCSFLQKIESLHFPLNEFYTFLMTFYLRNNLMWNENHNGIKFQCWIYTGCFRFFVCISLKRKDVIVHFLSDCHSVYLFNTFLTVIF